MRRHDDVCPYCGVRTKVDGLIEQHIQSYHDGRYKHRTPCKTTCPSCP